MLLADVVTASREVAATRSRKAKVEILAACLAQARPEEREIAASYLAGSLLQRRTGLGWRGVSTLPEPAEAPMLTLAEVHDHFERLSVLAGPGSQHARATLVQDLFGRATAAEQPWLRGVVTGAVRQGALEALLQEAVAKAADVPLAAVRRAAMLAGGTVPVVATAFEKGEPGLADVGLEVLRPVLPMLAASAPDIEAALDKAGPDPVAVETKLDGIRIQVHRLDDEVVIATHAPQALAMLEDPSDSERALLGALRTAPNRVVLHRDPRFALHGPTFHPVEGEESDWPGEAKVAGRAIAAGAVSAGEGDDAPEGELFVADIGEVVVTGLDPSATKLVVEWWTPDGGLRRVERD